MKVVGLKKEGGVADKLRCIFLFFFVMIFMNDCWRKEESER
jgi:hypothetical protein